MKKAVSHLRNDRGTALLIVMLQIAAVSVIALGIVQQVRVSLQTSAVSAARGQAIWFVLGAEDFAAAKLGEAMVLTEGKINTSTPGLNIPITFQIGEGKLVAKFQDQTNCFNLNSLAQTDEADEETEALGRIDAAQFYEHLLQALDFDPTTAQMLRASLQDWIDADNQPRLSGAETSYYATLETPYAAANTMLATPTELRAIRGYTADVYKRIQPHVCVRPDMNIGPFNINTLTPEDYPLVAPLFSGEIEPEIVAQELENYSGEIFDDAAGFLASPAFSLIQPEKTLDTLIDIQSTHFRLTGEVVYLDTVTSYEAVFAVDTSGEARLLRRRFGVDE